MRRFTFFLFVLFLLGLFNSCDRSTKPLEDGIVGEIKTSVNPYGKVPLGAEIQFTTKKKCFVTVKVEGDIPVERSFSTSSYNHSIPVLGLYPDTINTITIALQEEGGGNSYIGNVTASTDPLPAFMPEIDIKKIDRNRMEPGFHLVDQLIANYGKFLTYTIMFDDNGVIRWYMDMSSMGQITYTPYRLQNGNWLYLTWIDIIEVNDLGKVISQQKMWNYAGDHDLVELDNGRILMGGSKKDAFIMRESQPYNSRFDFVVEWDLAANKATREWDLRKVLDVDRTVYPPDFSLDFNSDWYHINSIDYNDKDKSLVVSGRNQGVLKVDYDNNLKWILAAHRQWGRAGFDGKGIDTREYLLTAIDTEGNPYPEPVQNGSEAHEDFEWPTGQHAVTVLENGNILLFDNGLLRNFQKGATYSRAVEYEIDEEKRTIKQVWQFGKVEGLNMYSAITSDVDVLPATGNRLVVAGNVRAGDLPPHASIIEITYPNNEKVFEAHVYFKDNLGTKAQEWAQFDLVYRGERYPLINEN
jgi:arylsulfate sulfotransferase